MDVHARLLAIAATGTSRPAALRSATRAVADALSSEGCSIFLRKGNGGLQEETRWGPPPSADVLALERALAEKTLREVLPATDQIERCVLLAMPVAAINHPIGAIVTRRSIEGPYTKEETMRLSGVASELVELVASVRLLETIGRSATETNATDDGWPAPSSTGERILEGIAASPGVAVGEATFRNAFPQSLVRRAAPSVGPDSEKDRARDGFEKTRNDLVRLQTAAASEIGEDEALIFGTHLLLLGDPILAGLVGEGLAGGRSAAISVDDAFNELVRRLREAPDPYIQERVEDIEDLRSRILGYLVGVERRANLDTRVVVSARTTPSLVLELKGRGAVGIVSELGGATSHGVLLARAIGVPAVTGIRALTQEVMAGDLLIVDGDRGRVIVRPSAETRAAYDEATESAERTRTEYLRYRNRPARTADGVRFGLQANIALGVDLAVARENRAEGIGLYRTEFPFIVRDALPTVAEQARIYAKAYEAFPTAPVTLRLLDLAGDKFVASRELGVSRDAFHGYRSIRILFDYPHVLRDQVQAFAIAAAGRDLRILIPMVTSLEDVRRIKNLVASSLEHLPRSRGVGRLLYGAMIETPAGVELVADLARETDFFSLGTNDLVQYTLVVDREDPRLASDRHAYHPAILRMIRRVVSVAHSARKPVSVCGEMAARPDLAIALLALGVDTLSVTPRAIPALKQALAGIPLEPLRSSLDALLALATTDELVAALRRYAQDGAAIGGAETLPAGSVEADASTPRVTSAARRLGDSLRPAARKGARRRLGASKH